MRKIHVLQSHIANQIAAGEVVERPVSVVKELVENAIDAGATSITVEIRNGGIDEIRVTDNGAGILAEECLIAFERHATSKITSSEDLHRIETLGFRGEALASIASVAQVELKTRTESNEMGMHVRIEGGTKKFAKPIGCAKGTTMRVENLFYNVPARRKFLKSARAEAASIADFMSRMILARPDISIRFINNSNNMYHSLGDGKLQHAIYCVYGNDIMAHLLPIAYDDGYISLHGYIGDSTIAKANRGHQSFFLNGRYIHSFQLSNALLRAFDMQLMTKRFPVAILMITISAMEVDVNVHPAKLEVRFADEQRVTETIRIICEKALNQKQDMPALLQPKKTADSVNTIERPPQPALETEAGTSENLETFSLLEPMIKSSSFKVKEQSFEIPHYHINNIFKKESEAADRVGEASSKRDNAEKTVSAEARLEDAAQRDNTKEAVPVQMRQQDFHVNPVMIVGQAFNSFWIVQQEDALYLIDQHAAHERQLYETMMSADQITSSQSLLMPEMITLTHVECNFILEHLEVLQSIGFEIEIFGSNTVRVFAVPSLLAGSNIAPLLQDIVSQLTSNRKWNTLQLQREQLIQASCKHAVKAGDRLSNEEIEELLRYFRETGVSLKCPHGRPIMIRLSKKELEKMFKRIV